MTERTPSRRSALVMIAVLALLVVTTALATGWTAGVLLGRRQAGLELMHRQAERLADAAIARAVARARADADYDGEVWRIDPSELGQTYGAEVRLSLDAANEKNPRRVVARVSLPAGSEPRVRHTQVFDLPPNTDSLTSPANETP